jgi:formate hydrogenlyase transcriptional activator
MHRNIDSIQSDTMQALARYPSLGNISYPGPWGHLQVPLIDLKEHGDNLRGRTVVETLKESQRKQILNVLNAARWIIAGPEGAAAILGLKRSTSACRPCTESKAQAKSNAVDIATW